MLEKYKQLKHQRINKMVSSTLFLFLIQLIIEVKNISPIGTKLINIKNNNFYLLRYFKFKFFIKKNDIIKNGISIPICLPKNIKG